MTKSWIPAKTLLLVAAALSVALTPRPSFTQERTITGQITTGRADAPFGGALVRVVGDTRSTCAISNGAFALDVPDRGVLLEILPLGYPERAFPVPRANQHVLFNMERNRVILDDILVEVPRVLSADTKLSGATVATLESDELTRVSSSTVEQAMQAKVAGVEFITSSGAPGGGMRAEFRGISTLLGTVDPLWIVDGVIVSNASIPSGSDIITSPSNTRSRAEAQDNVPNRISDLNPDDIEKVEVLRGSAAAAMYGSKASNGVVLITSKRGKTSHPTKSPQELAMKCVLLSP